MRYLKTIRIIFTFYKTYLLASVLVTVACLGLFWEYGMPIFAAIFWLKLVSLAIIFWFINSYKNKEYYYYQNLGISRVLLWGTTLLFDIALFIFLVRQLYALK